MPGLQVGDFSQHQAVDTPVLAALPCPVVHDREGGEVGKERGECSAANRKLAAMPGGDHVMGLLVAAGGTLATFGPAANADRSRRRWQRRQRWTLADSYNQYGDGGHDGGAHSGIRPINEMDEGEGGDQE